ncbi:hypothetical protein OT109_17285 [Phycisphaeraceae bacterium D3-23]
MSDHDPQAETTSQPITGAPLSVEATLSTSDLDDLFRDLAACTIIQHIAIKDSVNQSTAVPIPVDLVKGRLLLDQPHINALQLRYTYRGEQWIDTITRQQGEYHLLRVSH